MSLEWQQVPLQQRMNQQWMNQQWMNQQWMNQQWMNQQWMKELLQPKTKQHQMQMREKKTCWTVFQECLPQDERRNIGFFYFVELFSGCTMLSWILSIAYSKYCLNF